jgi:hypothetical protein
MSISAACTPVVRQDRDFVLPASIDESGHPHVLGSASIQMSRFRRICIIQQCCHFTPDDCAQEDPVTSSADRLALTEHTQEDHPLDETSSTRPESNAAVLNATTDSATKQEIADDETSPEPDFEPKWTSGAGVGGVMGYSGGRYRWNVGYSCRAWRCCQCCRTNADYSDECSGCFSHIRCAYCRHM